MREREGEKTKTKTKQRATQRLLKDNRLKLARVKGKTGIPTQAHEGTKNIIRKH